MRAPSSFFSTGSTLHRLSTLVLAMLLTACGGGGGGSSTSDPISSTPSGGSSSSAMNFPAVELNSPDALAEAIHFDGGYSVVADIPAPADASGGTISVSSEVAITAGGSTQFDLAAEGIPAGMYVHAYLIQIEGSERSFVIPVNADGQPYSSPQISPAASEKLERQIFNKASAGAVDRRTQLNCNGYPNLRFTAGGVVNETPSYEAPAKVYAYLQADVPPINPPVILIPNMSRERNNWTAPAKVNMKAVQVGNGKLQITLTWNSGADVDLHLEEPDGNIIYFANDRSRAGDGYLDVDDMDGFGPENIFYEKNVPNGRYTVKVNLFSAYFSDLPTSYTVKVKRDNHSETFNGTLYEDDETDEVTTFTMGSGSGGTGSTTGPGSAAPGSYATRPNTLLNSAACQGYTNDNFMEYFAQNSNGPDVQLHTLCAGAFNYYSMYLNAIRMGYSEAEANITYSAFQDAALVATEFYANAR